MAQIAMRWSPSTSAPVGVDGQHPVGVTVEGQPDVGALGSTTAACRSSGWVEPQPALMLVPSGSAWITVTSAPSAPQHRRRDRRRRAVGAVEDDPQPVEPAAVERRRRGGSRSRRPAVGIAVHDADPGAGRRGRRPSRRRARARGQLGLEPSLGRVVELAATRREELDAVVGERVVRRRDHRRGHAVGAADANATPGVGSTPRSIDVDAFGRQPGGQRRRRASGPTAGCRGRSASGRSPTRPRTRPRAAEGERQLGGELDVGDAADAVGAELHASRDVTRPCAGARPTAISAWSTAAPCGPSSGRTSSIPSRGRRG